METSQVGKRLNILNSQCSQYSGQLGVEVGQHSTQKGFMLVCAMSR